MSGFEVVGLLLAVYPLIGTAIQAYQTVKTGRSRATSLALWLKIEQSLFRQFVHKLLAPNVSEAELVILENPTSSNIDLWKDPTLHTKLEARLGSETASTIIEILQEVNGLLGSLRDELSPTNQSPERRIKLPRRLRANLDNIRHNLPQSGMKNNLDIISRDNQFLVRLLADYSMPNKTLSGTVSAPVRQYLRRDSSYAVDFYYAMCGSYRCNCNAPHVANFGIPRITHANDSSVMRRWQFNLLFPVGEESNTPDDEFETKGEQSGRPEYDSPSVSDFGFERLSVTWSQNSVSGEPSITKLRKQRSRSISIRERQSGIPGKYELGPIQDLCVLLKTLDTKISVSSTSLGVLQLKEKQYELQMPFSGLTTKASQDVESLDDLLKSRNFLLSRRERIGLALKLSYAILQFYYTPWIAEYWTWKDFCLDEDEDPQLFISRKFYSTRKGPSASNSNESLPTGFWAPYREPTLTRLGFALIELALGRRLADLRPEQPNNHLDPHTLDLRTAQKLVDDGSILREEGRVYEDIVSACLNHQVYCRSESRLVNLVATTPTFHENVEQCIIAPLHNMWTTCWGDV